MKTVPGRRAKHALGNNFLLSFSLSTLLQRLPRRLISKQLSALQVVHFAFKGLKVRHSANRSMKR